ncbi:hypothetical protein DFH08DRAFT_824871 [Mycena albidolilacea]|uniref:FAD-binding PCMH-type domain-containing protein n=1 Tax=Mycena albidolilacea TaxID=1033008 RepID=A0AAD6Z3R6_9AGAR|nr:hypothetical protein DFH08DRAFT_824871 [Mycena albidolilacea]
MAFTTLIFNSSRILDSEIHCGEDHALEYTTRTVKTRSSRQTTSLEGAETSTSKIDWKRQTFEIAGSTRKIAQMRTKRAAFSSSRYWTWLDQEEYRVKYEAEMDRTWTVYSYDGTILATFTAYTRRFLRDNSMPVLSISENITDENEQQFLILILLYSETKRLESLREVKAHHFFEDDPVSRSLASDLSPYVFVILDLFLVPNIRPDIRTELAAGMIGTTMFSHVGQLYIAARGRFSIGYLYLRPEILSQMAHPRSLETVPLEALFRDAAKVRLPQGVIYEEAARVGRNVLTASLATTFHLSFTRLYPRSLRRQQSWKDYYPPGGDFAAVQRRRRNFTCIPVTYASLKTSAFCNRRCAHGVAAVYPTDKDFKTVSQAFNERFTFYPIAVAFPTSVAQVSAAVAAGAAQNLGVVARSGGGRNGALVVDMSKLKAITVRSANNTAMIETGNRLGDVALALNTEGRAIPHGTCSYVGIGGHSAAGYGGFGFTSRAWGLTLDTVKSATVVLANGTVVQASSSANPDLFFCILQAIRVQTFPAPPSAIVFQYTWNNLDIETASNGIASFQTFAATNIPPEFGAELVFTSGDQKGQVNFELTGAWYGDSNLFNSTIAPYLKTLPKNPSSTVITPGSYIDSVAVLAAPLALNTSSKPDHPNTFYTKSLMTPSGAPMSNVAITSFVTYMANQGFSSNTDWLVELELYGGTKSAINAVPLDSTAFAKRDTLFTVQFHASSSNGDPPYPKDGFSFFDGMVASIIDRVNPLRIGIMGDALAYLNYIDDRLANAAKLYYGSHYQRLQSIKAALDPKDTFRFPDYSNEHKSLGSQVNTGYAQSLLNVSESITNENKQLGLRAVPVTGTVVKMTACCKNLCIREFFLVARGEAQRGKPNLNVASNYFLWLTKCVDRESYCFKTFKRLLLPVLIFGGKPAPSFSFFEFAWYQPASMKFRQFRIFDIRAVRRTVYGIRPYADGYYTAAFPAVTRAVFEGYRGSYGTLTTVRHPPYGPRKML